MPKRLHFCWEHQYQLEENGDYVCSICGYRTKDLSAEQNLQEYFSAKTDYKLSEIKELMQKLHMVSWYRNTRGQRIEYAVEEVKDVVSILIHYGRVQFIFDVNEDGSFPKLKLYGSYRKVECEEVFDIRQNDWLEQIEANWTVDQKRYRYSSDFELSESLRNQSSICRWYSELSNGKIYVYQIWKDQCYCGDYWMPMIVSSEICAKQYIYQEDKSLELIIYRDSDGESYSLSE